MVPTPPMRLPLLAVLLLPALATAQPSDLPEAGAPADSAAAGPAVVDSTAAASLFDWRSAVAEVQSQRAAAPSTPEPPAAIPLLQNALATASEPTLHVFGTTGLRVTLPAGWGGPSSAAEGELPGYALYSFRETTPGHPLEGAVLRVERVVGLNPLLRERFDRGLTSYGYHGAVPTGPASVPIRGFGLEVEGPGTRGAVVFVGDRQAAWAVSVQAPGAVWAARRDAVLAVLTGGDLP